VSLSGSLIFESASAEVMRKPRPALALCKFNNDSNKHKLDYDMRRQHYLGQTSGRNEEVALFSSKRLQKRSLRAHVSAAPLKLVEPDVLEVLGFALRAHVSAAPLKQYQGARRRAYPSCTPRSRERGPIEAILNASLSALWPFHSALT